MHPTRNAARPRGVADLRFAAALCAMGFAPGVAADPPRDFTRLVAHWAEYADPEYLRFIGDAKPEIAQIGFYGAHFWSLAHTAHGGGYPAHFPVRGHRECADWFERRNVEIHRLGTKIVGHLNVKFLVGDPDSDDGPRGFFRFYRDWDESLLGPKPTADPMSLLEVGRNGKPRASESYRIGGMREYWACLSNPDWRAVLKAWVRFGIARGVDGFIVNYFYRHDCHCEHCVRGFRKYLRERFSPAELAGRLGIDSLAEHVFDEIGAWHDPSRSTLLRREALRFSQLTNKRAFDEVLIEFGRELKPDLIVAQWNHLGDFSQLSGDERCLLPRDAWARGEDYLWYSTGGAANSTKLAEGNLGEATLQARYIRGASGGKPFTLGKYEHVRVRTAIAELAANGGAPMGFYTRFREADARREIVRYYRFLHRYDALYSGDRSYAPVLLRFPRRAVHSGDLKPLERFKTIGRRLLDEHVLFDVTPDDSPAASASEYLAVVDPTDPVARADTVMDSLPDSLSRFEAPATVRVSASRPARQGELTIHFVNYNRVEPSDGSGAGGGIRDERPIATPRIPASIRVPRGCVARRVEFLTPETDAPTELRFRAGADARVDVVVPSFLVYGVLRIHLEATDESSARLRPRVAGVVTEYRHNSHADVILSRLLLTDTLDGKGNPSALELASLYTDQRPSGDTSRLLAASHGFRVSETVADALTLGTGELAVDAVLLIAEHGNYPRSETGNIVYPKRRLWEQILEVFRASGRAVPVFIDKHIADNWKDAKFIYDTARELDVPLMAGSSLPVTWRRPAVDVPRGSKLREIVAITYHTTDAYGFHALEFVQALAEQRDGGETGIRAVESLAGDAVWNALDERAIDLELFGAAWTRLSAPRVPRERLRDAVPEPRLFRLEHTDGLRVHLLELNGAAGEWSAAWRYADGSKASSLFWTQEGRPGMHFTYLLNGIESMVETGTPAWNAERTLLTSGTLDALLSSLHNGQRRIETPHLELRYQPVWRWSEPPYPPFMRPWSEQ